MPFDTYDDALKFLFASTDYEQMKRVRYNADTFSLARMKVLLQRLGSPDRKFPSIHIAGTKGKGSTAALIQAIACKASLKTGLYTSPHLVDLRERIAVCGRMISPEALLQQIADAEPVIREMHETDAPTFFEIFTALCFSHFAAEGVDLAVAETGLGGRLDATNTLEPLVSVITAISFDHMMQLGETLAQIAGEKAGIIKSGTPVVCQPQPPEALDIIKDACRHREAPMTLIGRDVTYTWEPDAAAPGSRVSVRTEQGRYDNLHLPLMGEHQAINLAAAIAAAELAPPIAERLSEQIVRDAVAEVRWPGRMELIPGKPDILLDGAHNPASIERLIAGLGAHFPDRHVVFVFGAAEDKNILGMLAKISGTCWPVIFTPTQSPRSAQADDLEAQFVKCKGRDARAAADIKDAITEARTKAGTKGLIVITGSLYLVGEAKVLLEQSG